MKHTIEDAVAKIKLAMATLTHKMLYDTHTEDDIASVHFAIDDAGYILRDKPFQTNYIVNCLPNGSLYMTAYRDEDGKIARIDIIRSHDVSAEWIDRAHEATGWEFTEMLSGR